MCTGVVGTMGTTLSCLPICGAGSNGASVCVCVCVGFYHLLRRGNKALPMKTALKHLLNINDQKEWQRIELKVEISRAKAKDDAFIIY